MVKRTTIVRLAALVGASLLGAACAEPVAPAYPGAPEFRVVGNQLNGTLQESGTVLIKGFNPTNPHHGDAIVVSFFWLGSANIIQSVTDVLTLPGFPVVGNTYNLVEYVTSGGVSMATYVATNVQGFPDPYSDPVHGDSILAVRATLSQPVTDGGMMMKSYSGVYPIYTQALGQHSSAFGSGLSITTASPGAISVGAGSLVYGVSMSNGSGLFAPPAGFTNILTMSDASMWADGEDVVPATTGPVNPQWTWDFNAPRTWLASVLTLGEAVTQLAFTAQPSTSLPCPMTMGPVEVTAENAEGNRVTTYNGDVTIAIGHNGGALMNGNLSGTLTVHALNGVARFSDLCIDQPNLPGNGYTLQATVPALNLRVESSAFNIGVM
ncbi:MAG: hypothetical protein AUG85_06125 [Gemmatimonadetes bacterium 13_1_20CM_4_66_11]|nr:MAG: hypothetical protein AUG85_06125 [Gemmatimonadetes bacterium 13_1_20CM_4_66_11]